MNSRRNAAAVTAPWVIRNRVVIGCATITTDTRALWKANNPATYDVLARGGWIDDVPDLPEIGFPQVTFDPCLIQPDLCDPDPTVPDGPDDFTDQTTPTTVAEPDPETPEPGDPVVPTADPAPVVVAAPHFTG